MEAYVFVHLKSIHKGYITVTYKHNERLKGYRNRNYIDSSRSDQNYHLIEPQGPYMEEIKRKIEEAKAVPRTQSILLVEGLIGPSAEWIKAKNLDDQKKFFEYSLSFFTERIGAKNFVSAVVHMDEASPHMHFTFVPITQEGRVSVNAVMGGRLRDGAELQDRFHEHITKRYPEIQRGISRAKTQRPSLPRHLYKSAAELNARYNDLYNAVQDINFINNKEKKEYVMKLLAQYTEDYSAIQYSIKTAEKYLGQVEDEANKREAQIKRLEEEIKGKDLEIARLKEDKEELKEEKKELGKLIAEVPSEIMDKIRETNKDRKERNEDI